MEKPKLVWEKYPYGDFWRACTNLFTLDACEDGSWCVSDTDIGGWHGQLVDASSIESVQRCAEMQLIEKCREILKELE